MSYRIKVLNRRSRQKETRTNSINYSENQRFFVNYTANEPERATVIAEYKTDVNSPNVALEVEKRLMTIPQPFGNHNGGMIAFGADGYLYIKGKKNQLHFS